jgi:molecular chaperone GrpE
MSEEILDKMEEEKVTEQVTNEEPTQAEETNKGEEKKEPEKKSSKKWRKDPMAEKLAELQEAYNQKNDQFLRLHAEFDNYRKRTLKEKMELTKTAGESIFINILPVVDDFERALQAIEKVGDEAGHAKEGIQLIYKRFTDYLKQNGIAEIEAVGKDFDTDLHEALTKIPAPSEELKGKVVDVIQKGYMLNDKVIRFAKVVIGE